MLATATCRGSTTSPTTAGRRESHACVLAAACLRLQALQGSLSRLACTGRSLGGASPRALGLYGQATKLVQRVQGRSKGKTAGAATCNSPCTSRWRTGPVRSCTGWAACALPCAQPGCGSPAASENRQPSGTMGWRASKSCHQMLGMLHGREPRRGQASGRPRTSPPMRPGSTVMVEPSPCTSKLRKFLPTWLILSSTLSVRACGGTGEGGISLLWSWAAWW